MAKDDTEASASTAFLHPVESASRQRETRTRRSWWSTRWKKSRAGRKLEALSRRTSTWRFIVSFGLGIALFVLILNLTFLIWSRVWHHGSNTLYKGQCGKAKTIITSSSLVINVLSTLLLGASNVAMQCLLAPTRAEVNKVHATGFWLDIGVSGLRNWSAIARWRKWAWCILLMSTVPLHLLYNSVIFSTSQANDYVVLLVAPDFLDGATPTATSINGVMQPPGKPSTNQLYNLLQDLSMEYGLELASTLQSNLSSLTRLENDECIRTYGTDYTTNFLNLLVVSKHTLKSSPDPILAGYEYFSAPSSLDGGDAFNVDQDESYLNHAWICSGQPNCNIQSQIRTASTWNITFGNDTQTARISHCLAQPVNAQCTVSVLPPVLAIVIVCNVLKAVCFTALLTKRNFIPLIILGDAIASFMTDPDHSSLSSGPLSAETVRKAYFANPLRYSTQHQGRRWKEYRAPQRSTPWHPARRYWASAVGPKRWTITFIGFLALWLTGVVFLYQEQHNGGISFSAFWTQGLGTPYPLATLQLPRNLPVIGLVLLGNLPQLVLSFVYLIYNDAVTCMAMSAEFVRHAHAYKGLRVTLPCGDQRTTYTLSLPFKVSIPLLATSWVLHWAMSQSLFLAKVNVLDPHGEVDTERSFTTLGWSALALLLLLIAGGLMLVALVVCGFRRFGAGAPTVGSNSRAMLAASFTLGDGREEALKKVKYGVLGNVGNGSKRVGFGSSDVAELSEDEVYG